MIIIIIIIIAVLGHSRSPTPYFRERNKHIEWRSVVGVNGLLAFGIHVCGIGSSRLFRKTRLGFPR